MLTAFFFNDTATTEIYTLSLHDALPISFTHHASRNLLRDRKVLDLQLHPEAAPVRRDRVHHVDARAGAGGGVAEAERSEEHTSELQSRQYIVCRLLI